MGLDIYMNAPDEKSDKYPEHLFRKTYLRSSYNNAGFNRVCENLIGMTLYDVFQPPETEYEFVPDWDACLERAKKLLEALKTRIAEAPYRVFFEFSEDPRPQDGEIKSGKEALDWYIAQKKEAPEGFSGAFTCAKGFFVIGEPLKVCALVRGKSFLGEGLYVIWQPDPKDWEWYIQAAEILVEFCEYGKKHNASIEWSA